MLLLRAVIAFVLFRLSSSFSFVLVVPMYSNSVLLYYSRIIRLLQEKGHHMSVLYLDWGYLDGQQKVHLSGDVPSFNLSLSFETNIVQLTGGDSAFNNELTFEQFTDITKQWYESNARMCRKVQRSTDLVDFLKRADLVLSPIYTVFFAGILRDLDVRTAWLAVGSYVFYSECDSLGIPYPASYVPVPDSGLSDRLAFFERIFNAALIVFMKSLDYPGIETVELRSPPNGDLPDPNVAADDIPLSILNGDQMLEFARPLSSALYYLGSTVSATTEALSQNDELRSPPSGDLVVPSVASNEIPLFVLNGEEVLEYARPLSNAILYLGNVLVASVKPLSSEWTEIVETAPKGFIVFSLGTIANTTLMPQSWKEAFLGAFIKFSDYKIIWRFEGVLPEVVKQYPHIKITNWLPQRELLGHPKCKLFITHGGYNSFLEATQTGKPVLMIPLFFDQQGNAKRAVRLGLGLEVNKMTLTAEKMTAAMQELLSNEKYSVTAKKLSRMLADKIIPSEDAIAHHIGRVVRRYRTIPRLAKRVTKLSTLQYYSLDIAIFLVLSCSASLWIFFSLLSFVWKSIRRLAC